MIRIVWSIGIIIIFDKLSYVIIPMLFKVFNSFLLIMNRNTYTLKMRNKLRSNITFLRILSSLLFCSKGIFSCLKNSFPITILVSPLHNFLGGNREYIVIIKSRRISKDNIAMVFIFHFNCIAKV